MGIQITHVRFSSPTTKTHETIIRYKWTNDANGNVSDTDKPTTVGYVDKGITAYVGTGSNRVDVDVVRESGKNPFLRTYADGKPTNNLINLPTF
jgi:hypothetical protein